MIVSVNITQEHIDKGKKAICTACPVALAINEHLKEGYKAVVTGFSFRISPVCYLFRLPYTVTKFIQRFDWLMSVEPFSFELDIPDEYLRTTGL